MFKSMAPTSIPPTISFPTTTVSSCSERIGAALEQLAACVTLSGVGTECVPLLPETLRPAVLPSNCQRHCV